MCTNPIPSHPQPDKDKTCGAGRKKLWQLNPRFHCSMIGTCLTLEELALLHRKLRVTLQAPVTDYALHLAFVVIAGTRGSHAARRLHKYLDQKYRATIRRFAAAKRDEALEALWDETTDSGELAGAYWALVTHPSASEDLLDRVYGDVHMLSHLAGAQVRVDIQELQEIRRQSAALRRQLAAAESRLKAQSVDREALNRRLHNCLIQTQAAEGELDQARARLRALEGDPLCRRLQEQIAVCEGQLQEMQARAARAEDDAREWKRIATEAGDRRLLLEGRLAELQAERDALEAAMERLLSPDCVACPDQEHCDSNIDLFGRCVLYVGGRNQQCAHFRILVERGNGQFIHHDGGLHHGGQRLGTILSKADAVFCPLDCISHDAANRVKRFCKRYGKKVVWLPRSSLAAFVRGLNEVAA